MVIKMVCMILGGGVGSRLFPLTEVRSKPAVPIAGKYRLIDIPISNCLNSGVRRMFVLTQFNSASLNQHIKNTYIFDNFSQGFVDILAAEQTPTGNQWYQGTADAVRQCMRHLYNHDYDYILILSGDQLYQMDLEEMARYHIVSKADITIATIPVNDKDATGFGIMKVNQAGFIDSFIEKPATELLPDWTSEVSEENKAKGKHYLASMGIYIFSKDVIKRMFSEHPEDTDFGKQIIPTAITSGSKVASYQYDGYWEDIGTIRSFFDANIELADNLPRFNLFDNKNLIYTRPRMLAPAKIFGTQLDKVLLAEGSIIHAKEISNSVIGIRSRVGKDTTISQTILMGNDYFQTLEELMEMKRNTKEVPLGIGDNCFIKQAILDKNCKIGDNVSIIGDLSLEDAETDTYKIVDGVIVVKKESVIPNGTQIGMPKA